MNTRTASIISILLFLALPNGIHAQDQNPFLSMSVPELAQTWLLRTCAVEDEGFLDNAITRHSRELTAIFTTALEQGAPEELVNEVRESALDRFHRNRITLKDAGKLGLTPEDAQRAKNRTPEEFVNRAVLSFKSGYRSQTQRGLSLLAAIKPAADKSQI